MKLLCIDDTKGKGSEYFDQWVEVGETYTLRRAEGSFTAGNQRYLLKEIKNPPIYMTELGMKVEPGFSANRFVKLEDDKAESAVESSKLQAVLN